MNNHAGIILSAILADNTKKWRQSTAASVVSLCYLIFEERLVRQKYMRLFFPTIQWNVTACKWADNTIASLKRSVLFIFCFQLFTNKTLTVYFVLLKFYILVQIYVSLL